MKVFKNVNITVIDSKKKVEKDKEEIFRKVSATTLADIISTVSNVTFREAIWMACQRDNSRIIRLAQSLHGVLYALYNRNAKGLR